MRLNRIDGIATRVTSEWLTGKNTGGHEQPTREEVSRLAYVFYETRGREHGHDLEDWLRAERELERHLASALNCCHIESPSLVLATERGELAVNVPVKNDVLSQRRATFRQLHRGRCFVMPNPWDVGSARYLEQAGFPALATTSGGFAFSRGLPDSEAAVSRERMLQHIADIVAAVDVPVSADFASCYGIRPEDVEDSVERCIATGIAGLSMEDASGDPASPLYDPSLAVARVQAARRAIDRSGSGVVLTARTECFRLGHPDAFRESIRRLQAYSEAGADVLFAPGVRLPNQIQVLVEAVRPKPLHLLVSGNIGLDVEDIAALGVRRISVGSALALAAWAGMMRAAKTLRNLGSFAGFDDSVSFARMNEFLTADLESRRLAGSRT